MPSTSPTPTPARRRLAHLTAAWGVLFAVVHAYWAAGGAAGMNGDPADTLGAQLYIAVIALIGLASAGVALGLAQPPHRTLTRLARVGGTALLLGVAVGTGRWLVSWSLNGDGVAGVITTLYFLLGGILFLALARSRADAGRDHAHVVDVRGVVERPDDRADERRRGVVPVGRRDPQQPVHAVGE
jgi:hypothetical protein